MDDYSQSIGLTEEDEDLTQQTSLTSKQASTMNLKSSKINRLTPRSSTARNIPPKLPPNPSNPNFSDRALTRILQEIEKNGL